MKKDVSKKILICLYLIIGLLVINTIFTISNSTTNSNYRATGGGNGGAVNPDHDVSMMKTLNINEIVALFDTEDTHVVYTGRATCPACVQFIPILQRAQKEFNYTTVFVDGDIQSNRERGALARLRDLLPIDYTMRIEGELETRTFGEWYYQVGYTPTTFIIRDGKMVDGFIGGLSFEDFSQFLEKNGIEK